MDSEHHAPITMSNFLNKEEKLFLYVLDLYCIMDYKFIVSKQILIKIRLFVIFIVGTSIFNIVGFIYILLFNVWNMQDEFLTIAMYNAIEDNLLALTITSVMLCNREKLQQLAREIIKCRPLGEPNFTRFRIYLLVKI